MTGSYNKEQKACVLPEPGCAVVARVRFFYQLSLFKMFSFQKVVLLMERLAE